MQVHPLPIRANHVPWLDGLRGIAAFWVLAHHVHILVGMHAQPILSWGTLAVDLFMLLSGYLMTHHYLQRRDAEPWQSFRTIIKFWVRRFFRIAPLYYALLTVALLLGPYLGHCRAEIIALWPDATTPLDRYTDASPANIFLHLSFLFGVFPLYAFRTPLPDWSIGLEMQYYLVFPAVMLLIARFGAFLTGLTLVAVCLFAQWLLTDYFAQFAMPSFLPMKFSIFMIGMWAAIGRSVHNMTPFLLSAIGTAILASCLSGQSVSLTVFFVGMVVCFYYLMNDGSLPLPKKMAPLLQLCRKLLSGKFCEFLGNTSFGVYLLHLLVILPLLSGLIQLSTFALLPQIARFFLCLALAIPPVYGGAWLLYYALERPGIRAGKAFLKRLRVG